MTSQPGKQTITIHISPNISKRKSNQTMKFGQLIEYNMKNIFFLKNHTQNVVEKLKCSHQSEKDISQAKMQL